LASAVSTSAHLDNFAKCKPLELMNFVSDRGVRTQTVPPANEFDNFVSGDQTKIFVHELLKWADLVTLIRNKTGGRRYISVNTVKSGSVGARPTAITVKAT
jgi:hypothetical protein